MKIITRTNGHFIINGVMHSLKPGEQVSYREDAIVEEFATDKQIYKEWERRHPEVLEDPDWEITKNGPPELPEAARQQLEERVLELIYGVKPKQKGVNKQDSHDGAA